MAAARGTNGGDSGGPPDEAKRSRRMSRAATARANVAKEGVARRYAKYQDRPVVSVVAGIYQRDRDAAGSVVGSAIAYRLFLFFVPLLLFLVGVAGLVSGIVSPRDVNTAVGFSGGLASQVRSAFRQSGATPWFATVAGFVGMVGAGRSLSKALVAASASAWRLPVRPRASFRVVGAVVGLAVGISLVTALLNRVRLELGLGVQVVATAPAFATYVVVWMIILLLLPRDTDDPGALLPGTLLLAVTITVMHALSQFYLPERLTHASQLYGSIGTAIVTLGWFFIVGRAVVVAMGLNAVMYERFGSVSRFVFSLPIVRFLPRHSARLRRMFGLDEPRSEKRSA